MRGPIENAGYLAFFDALVAGRLTLGQTLTQDELCAVLDMSLSPMRETITLLESEGLISVRRRIGITIFYPDVKFVGNTFQLRGLLEVEGLRKFARNVKTEWLRNSRKDHEDIIAFVTRTNDLNLYREPVKALEAAFHGSFIDSFENEEISAIYARLSQKMFVLRVLHLDAVGPSNTVKSMTEHLAILDALDRRNIDAAVEALENHLSGVLRRILAK